MIYGHPDVSIIHGSWSRYEVLFNDELMSHDETITMTTAENKFAVKMRQIISTSVF